jgi:hypothetical protein
VVLNSQGCLEIIGFRVWYRFLDTVGNVPGSKIIFQKIVNLYTKKILKVIVARLIAPLAPLSNRVSYVSTWLPCLHWIAIRLSNPNSPFFFALAAFVSPRLPKKPLVCACPRSRKARSALAPVVPTHVAPRVHVTVTIHRDSRLPPLACLIRGNDLQQCLLTAPRTIVPVVVNADRRCPLALDPQERRDWDPLLLVPMLVSEFHPPVCGQIKPLCTCLFAALREEKIRCGE